MGVDGYTDAVEVEACSADVTPDTCSAAALALDTSASDGKYACVFVNRNCDGDDDAKVECLYYEQSADAGAEDLETWDPRSCDTDDTYWGGVVEWNSDLGALW